MQIYKTFLKMLIRNLPSGLLYLGIFVGIAIAVTNNSQHKDMASFTSSKVNVAVIDDDNSELSKSLADYISSCHNIVNISDNKEKWADELFYRTVDYILVINKGFEDGMAGNSYADMLESYSAPDSNTSYIVQSQAESYIQNVSACLNSGLSMGEACKKAADIAKIHVDVTLSGAGKNDDISDAMPAVKTISYFFTFFPYVVLCLLINTLGSTLIIWNKPELKARTAVSGTSFAARNAGIVFGMLTFAFIVIIIFTAVCVVMYKDDFFTKATLYFGLNALCYMLVSISVTYLIAQLSKKLSALSIWSNIIGLSTSFLCGVFVSRELLPDKVVALSKCLPTYWYINVTEELKYYNGSSLSRNSWISMGIQLLFAAAIMIISLVVIKSRQSKQEMA